MLIKNTNSATSTLHDRDFMPEGYVVSFDDDDVARVKAAVGEALVEKYSGIESADAADDDAGAEPDEPDEPPDSGDEEASGGDDGPAVVDAALESADDNSDNGSDNE